MARPRKSASKSRGGTQAPQERGVGRPYLAGLVLHAHRNVSLFLNRSTNYQAVNQSDRTIDDKFLPALNGRGIDTGVKFSTWQNRISGSIDYFETDQKNVRDSTLGGSKTTWINAIWDAIDASKRPPSRWTDKKDQRTRGLEVQLVANATKNLRLMANASRDTSILQDHGASTFAYLAANYPIWDARASTPVSSADGANVGQLVTRIKQEESDDRRVIGIRQTRVYEWQANFIGRYQFDRDTPLRGFAVGSAARWRTAPVIGYARVGNVLDPTRPFKGLRSTNLDGWLDYERTFALRGTKIRWSAQLRIQNVFDDRTLHPWTADDDGTGRPYIQSRRTPSARQFVLSSAFAF